MTTQTKPDPVLPPLPEPDVGMPGQVKFIRSDEATLAWGRACYAQARADLIAELQPVAVVVSAYGDPEAFAERELGMLTSIQALPIGTKLAIIPKE